MMRSGLKDEDTKARGKTNKMRLVEPSQPNLKSNKKKTEVENMRQTANQMKRKYIKHLRFAKR